MATTNTPVSDAEKMASKYWTISMQWNGRQEVTLGTEKAINLCRELCCSYLKVGELADNLLDEIIRGEGTKQEAPAKIYHLNTPNMFTQKKEASYARP